MGKMNEDDMLEKMAEVLSSLDSGQKKKLEMLMGAKSKNIKTTKKVHKISLGSEELILGEEAESTGVDEDGGIVQETVSKTGVYDCGHLRTPDNFGHQAECGHIACKTCVEKELLVCAKKGCMQKLCPKDDCYRFTVNNMNLCEKHAKELKRNLFLSIFNLHDRNIVCKPDDR